MGNPIIFEQKDDSPKIIMDYEKKEIIVEGPSFPEDAVEVYKPIITWINENEDKLNGLVCSFDYSILSSASNKMVFEVLIHLENLFKRGNNVTVKWLYSFFDEDMLDEGMGFKANLKVPIDLVEKQF
ncbi:MAG TPA: DUF1987 domain-containing protein [Bacteroidetes bacterium]|nr:DUF1987 domain-containing protein [Bacteroidota bacterium]